MAKPAIPVSSGEGRPLERIYNSVRRIGDAFRITGGHRVERGLTFVPSELSDGGSAPQHGGGARVNLA
jgi:hypothetical protein